MLKPLWAVPCTALGLLAALPLILFTRAKLSRVDSNIELVVFPGETPSSSWLARLPFAAITLGQVILACSEADLARLRRHEQAHVRQYQRWGIMFLLAYPAASLWAWVLGRHPYRDNGFEIQARREETWAGTGPVDNCKSERI